MKRSCGAGWISACAAFYFCTLLTRVPFSSLEASITKEKEKRKRKISEERKKRKNDKARSTQTHCQLQKDLIESHNSIQRYAFVVYHSYICKTLNNLPIVSVPVVVCAVHLSLYKLEILRRTSHHPRTLHGF
jgi:hypothetical protein